MSIGDLTFHFLPVLRIFKSLASNTSYYNNKDQFNTHRLLTTWLLHCHQETIKTRRLRDCSCCSYIWHAFYLIGTFPDVSSSFLGVFENSALFSESISPKTFKIKCSGWIELDRPSLPFFNEAFCSVIRWKEEQYLQDLIYRYNIMRNLTQIYVPACNGVIRIFVYAGECRPKGIFHFLNKDQPNLGGSWS